MNWLKHDKEILKRCPFCGGRNVRTVIDHEYELHFGVKCFDCGGCIDAEKNNAKEAVDAWNKRKGIPIVNKYVKQERNKVITEVLKILDEISDDSCITIGYMTYGGGKDELKRRVSVLFRKGDEQE